jgi:predicted dehydrogenase
MATGAIAVAFAADLAHADSGRVVAVGSRRSETAEAFGDRFDVPNRHGSYDALVADPEVDVVYVATPAPMHLDGARLALRAGKPVLVEKPFTANAAEARELVALARDAGLFAMEAMWTRFLPHIVEIRRLLAEGALGRIVTVCADHGQHIEGNDHRLFAPELGGGALLDLGVYPVSFASMVLGAPERVISLVTPAFGGVDGQTSMLRCLPARCRRGARRAPRSSAPTRGSRSTATSTSRRRSPCSPETASRCVSKEGTGTAVCRAAACTTKPTRSRVAWTRACWRARSCRSRRPSRSC